MEKRLGHDFASIRIHDDAAAGASARTLGAAAYTVGHDIALAPNAPRPDTARGRGLLAHELTHAVQQTRGPGGPAGLRHELEAHDVGQAVAAGRSPTRIATRAPLGIACAPSDWESISRRFGIGVPRALQERASPRYSGLAEMALELQLIQQWLARSDLDVDERDILSLEEASLRSSLGLPSVPVGGARSTSTGTVAPVAAGVAPPSRKPEDTVARLLREAAGVFDFSGGEWGTFQAEVKSYLCTANHEAFLADLAARHITPLSAVTLNRLQPVASLPSERPRISPELRRVLIGIGLAYGDPETYEEPTYWDLEDPNRRGLQVTLGSTTAPDVVFTTTTIPGVGDQGDRYVTNVTDVWRMTEGALRAYLIHLARGPLTEFEKSLIPGWNARDVQPIIEDGELLGYYVRRQHDIYRREGGVPQFYWDEPGLVHVDPIFDWYVGGRLFGPVASKVVGVIGRVARPLAQLARPVTNWLRSGARSTAFALGVSMKAVGEAAPTLGRIPAAASAVLEEEAPLLARELPQARRATDVVPHIESGTAQDLASPQLSTSAAPPTAIAPSAAAPVPGVAPLSSALTQVPASVLSAASSPEEFADALRRQPSAADSAGPAWDHTHFPNGPTRRWQPGDAIDMPSATGDYPSYASGVVRGRYWRNRASNELEARARGEVARDLSNRTNPMRSMSDDQLRALRDTPTGDVRAPLDPITGRALELEHGVPQRAERWLVAAGFDANEARRLAEVASPRRLMELGPPEHAFFDVEAWGFGARRADIVGARWTGTAAADVRSARPLADMSDATVTTIVQQIHARNLNLLATAGGRQLRAALQAEIAERGLPLTLP